VIYPESQVDFSLKDVKLRKNQRLGKEDIELKIPRFIKNVFGDLLAGLTFWFPIWVVILVLGFIFGNLENWGGKAIRLMLPDQHVYPGFGILLALIIIYLSGIILKKTALGDFLSRIPILGIFFRRKGGEIITIDRLLHLPPCLFLYSPSCPSYGWILSEEKVRIDSQKAEFGLINVYYPNVPSILTGQIFPVRRETVIKLGNPSREIIDLLLYALRSPEDIHYLPWEGENEEEFKERAKYFGLNLSADF